MPGYAIPTASELLVGITAAVTLLVVGHQLPRRLSLRPARLVVWLAALASIAVVHHAFADAPDGNRMLAIVATFMLATKGVVHTEYTLTHNLPPLPALAYLKFCLVSLGMHPAPAHRRPRPLSPPTICLLAGVAVLAAAGITYNTVLLFIGLTLTVHFGLANLSAAIAGQPPLFKNPLTARSPAHFWSHCWNLGYVGLMAIAVRRPLGAKYGIPAAFLASGLIHELAITLPIRSGYGLPTLYFAIQAAAVSLSGNRPWPLPLTTAFIAAPLPLLFPRAFIDGVLWPLINIYP